MVAVEPRRSLRRALRRPAQHEALQAGAAELLGHQLAHLGRPEQQRGTAVEIAVDAAREIERGGGERHRPLGDAGVAPDAAGAAEGGDEDILERRRDEPMLRRRAMRRSELTQHMRLADDETVERARHAEEMTQRRLALVAIERAGDACLGMRRARSDERREGRHGLRVMAHQLDAIAGGDQHALSCAGMKQRLERAVGIGFEHGEAIAQFLTARAMVHADDDEILVFHWHAAARFLALPGDASGRLLRLALAMTAFPVIARSGSDEAIFLRLGTVTASGKLAAAPRAHRAAPRSARRCQGRAARRRRARARYRRE